MRAPKTYSANSNIQIALIGSGGQGQSDTHQSVQVPGVKLVAACDCYDGRLKHMKEVYGADIQTTKDYREIVSRPDIDAVIVATPDHWHTRISVDCMNAGKHVYCEKPMVHAIEEGKVIVDTQAKTGMVFQVGSQYRSSMVYQKARDLLQAKAIGKLNSVEAWLDRNSAIGAWEYSIPSDASPDTCDWKQFQGSAPNHAWDANRFFRWRNFRDYGTGVAGDLFVHLLTGIHTVTNSMGPTRVYATGGTRYWKDRDVPDVMLATLDYPETEAHPAFNVILRVNFKSSLPQERFGLKFVGSEGVMSASGFSGLQLERTPRPEDRDYTVSSFAEPMQKAIWEKWEQKHPEQTLKTSIPNQTQSFDFSEQNAHLDHFKSFYASIRTGAQNVEDPTFGLRTAGPALLTNESYFKRQIVGWDPVKMTTTKA